MFKRFSLTAASTLLVVVVLGVILGATSILVAEGPPDPQTPNQGRCVDECLAEGNAYPWCCRSCKMIMGPAPDTP